ncbi:hypothetical protein TRAPUB_12693 [Trametes pubescens]|uniref:Uncharacterized protein n=1 Tax=Trametes pubescens TaxID=154538 RepID=A0A1M2VT99_TRAPU|nr:hypothetical protein TRAPUB_12693 [Trametes pubescens]
MDSDVRAQYKIELAAAGMEDGPPSTLTSAERLRVLKAHQEAWDKLAWTSREEVPMHQGGVWELYGGVLAQGDGSRTLAFKQLPSAIRGIEEREWRIEDVGVNIRDFGMDPAQDLLVVIENRMETAGMACAVHLKSLATGEPHPAAPRPATVSHIPARGRYSYTIQICDDYIAILMTSGDEDHSELLMWNWKTGTRRLHLTGSDLSSFAFLTSRYMLLTSLPTMELDDNNVFHGDDPRLLVIDLERMSDRHEIDFGDLDYLCAFHYPPLADNFATISMSIRSDPAPNWKPSPSLKVPFHVAHQDRLFVITLWVVEGNMHIMPFISLVPSTTFMTSIDTIAPGETGRVFEWSEWGPAGSRLIPAPPTHTSVWVCYVYGMMFAMSIRQGSQRIILALDFNPHSVGRVLAREAREAAESPETTPEERAAVQESAISVTDERLFRPANIFREEVRTSLPHVMRKTRPFSAEGEGHFDAVMVSEDSLVMVSSQSHIRKYRILTF